MDPDIAEDSHPKSNTHKGVQENYQDWQGKGESLSFILKKRLTTRRDQR